MQSFFMEPFISIVNNYELLKQLVLRNIAVRYKGTILGSLWTIVQPLFLLVVYSFVFSMVFKTRWGNSVGEIENDKYSFAIIMFCGMTIFSVFSDTISSAPGLIVSNPNYVKKVVFPIEILPVAQVISTVILNMIWFILLFLGAVIFLHSLSWTMLFLPIIFLPYILLTMGLSFFLASLGVFFRDISQFCVLIVQVLYMMTPIFYPLQMVPGRFKYILMLNPLTWFVEETRAVFLFGKLPNWEALGVLSFLSVIVFYLGYAWLQKTKKGFADVL